MDCVGRMEKKTILDRLDGHSRYAVVSFSSHTKCKRATDNIAIAIEDSQLLLQYLAENGVSIDQQDLSTLVSSRFSYQEGTLNAESEHLFW